MSYYKVCPLCGCNLDPGERCDCGNEKKATVSASNADSGKVENLLDIAFSASDNNRNFRRFQDEG